VEKHGDVRRFVKELIAGRLAWVRGAPTTMFGATCCGAWISVLRRHLNPADLGDACTLAGRVARSAKCLVQFFLMINATGSR